jgi:3-oxoacyl-[acyl-carrier-protein] synthase-1
MSHTGQPAHPDPGMGTPPYALDESMNALCVLETSAFTGVGLTAPSAAAGVRCGISSFGEYDRANNRLDEPAIVSSPPGIGEIEDVQAAITEMAVAVLTPFADGSTLPVFLALPEPRPGLGGNLAATVARAIREHVEGARVARPTAFGHAAGGIALREAADLLARSGSSVAAVVGADSYLHPETIRWLDQGRQLHTTYNAWGFIPGAAAGATLVSLVDKARPQTRWPRAIIEAIAVAEEEVPIKSGGVCLGRAQSRIVDTLANGLSPGSVFDAFYCDLNGEAYRSDELGFTLSRTSERFRNPAEFVAPADCWGDVGAASLPLFITLAIEAAERAYSPGPISLHLAGSESGLRAGLRLRTRQRSA